MTEERIITAATITTGEKNDGKELENLYNKSKETGMEIDTIIGDAAYSEKGNIELAKRKELLLVAKLNPSVTQGQRKKDDEFQFNKDAGMYICKAGHMAIRKARQGKNDSFSVPSLLGGFLFLYNILTNTFLFTNNTTPLFCAIK